MTSASSSSARSLFAESKHRLAERVQLNVDNLASVARQVQRGSRANELLMKAARDFAATESALENSESNLKKMHLISIHLGYQYDNIQTSVRLLHEVKEQAAAMQR